MHRARSVGLSLSAVDPNPDLKKETNPGSNSLVACKNSPMSYFYRVTPKSSMMIARYMHRLDNTVEEDLTARPAALGPRRLDYR